MSMLEGISQCWPLSSRCEVWWDAWAVGGAWAAASLAAVALAVAWIGIGVTAASTFAVWKLGVAANSASSEATRIAASEAEKSGKEALRREFRERTEELLILAQVNGEIGVASGRLELALEALHGGGVGKQLFLRSEKHRTKIVDDLGRITFPMSDSVRERLHYVDRRVAGCLLRATGIMALAQETCAMVGVGAADDDLAVFYDSLNFMLPLVRSDLEVVQIACTDAIGQLGLADKDIARAAEAFGSND